MCQQTPALLQSTVVSVPNDSCWVALRSDNRFDEQTFSWWYWTVTTEQTPEIHKNSTFWYDDEHHHTQGEQKNRAAGGETRAHVQTLKAPNMSLDLKFVCYQLMNWSECESESSYILKLVSELEAVWWCIDTQWKHDNHTLLWLVAFFLQCWGLLFSLFQANIFCNGLKPDNMHHKPKYE